MPKYHRSTNGPQQIQLHDDEGPSQVTGFWHSRRSNESPVENDVDLEPANALYTEDQSEDEYQTTSDEEARGFIGEDDETVKSDTPLFLNLEKGKKPLPGTNWSSDLEPMPSIDIFALAKKALADKANDLYVACKSELRRRADAKFEGMVTKAIGTAHPDKKKDKERRAYEAPKKPTKVATVQPGSVSKKKQYRYNKDTAPAPKAPQAPGADEPGPVSEQVSPKKLADLLQVSVDDLKTLARSYGERQFVAFFKTDLKDLVKKHRIPDSYLEEVHAALVAKSLTRSSKKP